MKRFEKLKNMLNDTRIDYVWPYVRYVQIVGRSRCGRGIQLFPALAGALCQKVMLKFGLNIPVFRRRLSHSQVNMFRVAQR